MKRLKPFLMTAIVALIVVVIYHIVKKTQMGSKLP